MLYGRATRRGAAFALLTVLWLPACRTEQAAVDRTGSANRPTPSEDQAANSSGGSPSRSVALSRSDLRAALQAARAQFATSPPSLHGTYEYRSESATLSYELWVDWPAFRVSFTARENVGSGAEETQPLTVATRDGKRFGVRDPLADETYVTRSLGEAPWVIGPMVNFFGDPDPCAEETALGVERVLGRPAIRVHCSKFEIYDTWVDERSGIVLRQVLQAPSEREPGWSGFVELEIDPTLDGGMFDPSSV